MATTSIWSVKGWLGRVVIYAENPAKTENPAFFERQGMTAPQAQNLVDVIDYAVQERKTVQAESPSLLRQLVTGVNCRPATARDEMMKTKRIHDKEGGVVAYHGYQSFAPGETSPELAHKIGTQLARQLWGNRYEVLVATHLDKANHIHNHFVVNTVSFVDGFRYYRSEKDYYALRQTSDDLCREYGLSVIEQPQPGKSQHYAEWQAEKSGKPTYRNMVKADLDRALAAAMTERQFFDELRHMGYTIKMGKEITVCPAGRERGLKLQRNFGDDYSREGIRRRILEQTRPKKLEPEPTRQVRVFLLHGTFLQARRMKGFRALNAIIKLTTKLEGCQAKQEHMKVVNAYWRRTGTCQGAPGITEAEAARIDQRIANPRHSWDTVPFASYDLTNNNAEIKRLEKRIAELTRNQEVGFAGWKFDGGRAEANTEANRLQLFFDERPGAETHSALRHAGFVYSHTNSAYQRQLNTNAIYAAGRLAFLKPSDGRSVRDHQPKAPKPPDTGAR